MHSHRLPTVGGFPHRHLAQFGASDSEGLEGVEGSLALTLLILCTSNVVVFWANGYDASKVGPASAIDTSREKGGGCWWQVGKRSGEMVVRCIVQMAAAVADPAFRLLEFLFPTYFPPMFHVNQTVNFLAIAWLTFEIVLCATQLSRLAQPGASSIVQVVCASRL